MGAGKSSTLERTTRPIAGETAVAMSTNLAPVRPLTPRTSQRRELRVLASGFGHERVESVNYNQCRCRRA
jgi:hypothetical protein